MTNEAFIDRYGFQPTNDDTERASCPGAGTIGHSYCGECEGCGMPKLSCRCAPWKRITNAERWVRTAHKPGPEPKGPATMPQQMIVEYHLGIRLGTVEITVQRDAYVFSIHEVASRIVLSATVNIDDIQQMNKEEKRIYWIAKTGDTLPSVQFAGWSKRYIGSVVTLAGEGPYHVSYHVWEMREAATAPDIATRLWDTPYPMPEMREKSPAKSAVTMSRELGAPYVPAVMERRDLDKLIRDLATGTEIDPEDYDVHELGWIFGHLDEINEWVAGERRIAELRTLLVASLTK